MPLRCIRGTSQALTPTSRKPVGSPVPRLSSRMPIDPPFRLFMYHAPKPPVFPEEDEYSSRRTRVHRADTAVEPWSSNRNRHLQGQHPVHCDVKFRIHAFVVVVIIGGFVTQRWGCKLGWWRGTGQLRHHPYHCTLLEGTSVRCWVKCPRIKVNTPITIL